jgi:hypothetical protein
MDNALQLQICRAAHKALHENGQGINVNGVRYYVTTAANGMRMIKFDDCIFIQQDPRRWGHFTNRVRAGDKITRIMRPGQKWGWIDDERVVFKA